MNDMVVNVMILIKRWLNGSHHEFLSSCTDEMCYGLITCKS